MNLLQLLKNITQKRKETLQQEIRTAYDEFTHVGMHGRETWDMYSSLHQKYHTLQARHLQRYGVYFREGNIGQELTRNGNGNGKA